MLWGNFELEGIVDFKWVLQVIMPRKKKKKVRAENNTLRPISHEKRRVWTKSPNKPTRPQVGWASFSNEMGMHMTHLG